MPVSLYTDVHVRRTIVEQLRRRGVDVLTAIEDGMVQADDDILLERAHTLGRVMFTQDLRFKALAEDWQRVGRPFSGLAFGHQLHSIGVFVRDLELIAKATDGSYWSNRVEYLPY